MIQKSLNKYNKIILKSKKRFHFLEWHRSGSLEDWHIYKKKKSKCRKGTHKAKHDESRKNIINHL